MGKHALVASQGARYSEHLGIRYDYNSNTPDMVWYTNAHEELYDIDSGNYLIYYHVNSADGQHGGWIWRGYLNDASSTQKAKTSVPVATPSTSTTGASSTTTSDNTTPATATTSTMDWTNAIQDFGLQSADVNLMKMFPNCVYDKSVEHAANDFIANGNNILEFGMGTPKAQAGVEYLLSGLGIQYKDFRAVVINVKDPDNSDEVAQALSATGYSKDIRDFSYSGWKIGGSIEGLNTYNENTPDGEGVVFLVQE